MILSLEQSVVIAVVLASLWFQATADEETAMVPEAGHDDVTVLASLLIV